jgi:hypothetical protein
MLLLGAPFEHADANDGHDRHNEAQHHTGSKCARQILVQLALTLRRRELLRMERAVVDLLNLRRDFQHRVPPGHDLLSQKGIAIDGGRTVEQRRICMPVLRELAPKLAVVSRIGSAQERFELGDHLLAFNVVGDEPRTVIGRGRGRVEQIVARQNPRKMQARAHAAQTGLDVAIPRVETLEMRVGGVGVSLRGQDRHDDQSEQSQQRERDNRPRAELPPPDTRRMLLGHNLILPR